MVDVYKDELYGNLLPNIYIDKITLENSGYIAPEENPHIDNEREEIEEVQQDESIKITLNVAVKEEYDNDTIGKWLSEVDFQKYMKIKIYEISDERLSSLMNLSKDFSVPLDLNTFSNSKAAVLRTLYGYTKTSRSTAISLIKNKVKIHNIEIYQQQSSGVDNNKQTSIEILDDGTKVLNTHFKKTIERPKSRMEHLSFYCASSLDYISLIKDFKMNPTKKLVNFLSNMNKVTGEILFDNYEVLNESYVFLGQDSKVWTGDVHKNEEGQYMTGIRQTVDSIPLQKRTVQNSTVQDFRRRQRLEKVNFDFNPVKKYFENFKPTNISTNTNFLSRTNSFFSDISISLDEDRDAKIKFSIALKNLVFETSKYSYLIKNHDSVMADELAKEAKIKSLKILRQRVKSTNTNNTPITVGKKYVNFSNNEIKKTLIHCADPSTVINTENFLLRKIPTALYPSIVEYTGIDKSASEITDGLYRYSLQIEIEDPFEKYLKDKIETLTIIKNDFEKYLAEAEKQTLSKYFAEIQNPHIAHPSEKDIMGTITEGNYNVLTNSFTQTFVNKMNEKYQTTTTAPWILYTAVYTDILSMFVEEVDRVTLQRELQKFSSPFTGSPEGIRMTVQLIGQLIFEIEKILGTKNVTDNVASKTSASKSVKLIIVEHTFENEVFDANLEGEVFVDYLNTREEKTQKRGIISLSAQNFRNRMESEIEKYFVSKNANITTAVDDGQIVKEDTRETSFSYLSPSKLIFKKNNIDLTPTADEKQKIKINNTISLAKSSAKKVYGGSLGEEDLDLSIFNSELRENFSVTISEFKRELPVTAPKEERVGIEKIPEQEDSKKEKIKVSLSRQITEIHKIPKATKKGIKEFISVIGPKANKKTKSFSVEKNKEKLQTTITEEKKKKMPIQITSILGGDSKDKKKNIVPEKRLSDALYSDNQAISNIGSLKEIQILIGYEKNKDGKIMINSPKWEKMTEEKVSAIPSNIEATCRLADFKEKDISAEDITKSGKIVNSTFTIVGEASPVAATIQPKRETYNTTVENKNIEVPKDLINIAVKNEAEKQSFPSSVTKTVAVSSQPIEEIVVRKDVKQATESKQKQVIENKQTLPKVNINKNKKTETKAKTKVKTKAKVKPKGKR
jgi:hypothetical protein